MGPIRGGLRKIGGSAVQKARGARDLLGSPRQGELRGMYLDLLEKALLHTLYDPPDRGEEPEFSKRAFSEALAGQPVAPMSDLETRAQGRDWPVYAQTMIGVKRLRNVRRCAQAVIRESVPGDLIECGCWRGGASILMRAVIRAHGADEREVVVADSFAGVPPPDPERYPADAGDLNHTAPELAVSLEEVRANFRRYGLLDDGVSFCEGWFRDTLPTLADRTWSLIRLDGDLYESTMDGLANLYPNLSPGGFLIVDDYGWDNCRQAIDDYRHAHGITEPIERIDWVGACWRKQG